MNGITLPSPTFEPGDEPCESDDGPLISFALEPPYENADWLTILDVASKLIADDPDDRIAQVYLTAAQVQLGLIDLAEAEDAFNASIARRPVPRDLLVVVDETIVSAAAMANDEVRLAQLGKEIREGRSVLTSQNAIVLEGPVYAQLTSPVFNFSQFDRVFNETIRSNGDVSGDVVVAE